MSVSLAAASVVASFLPKLGARASVAQGEKGKSSNQLPLTPRPNRLRPSPLGGDARVTSLSIAGDIATGDAIPVLSVTADTLPELRSTFGGHRQSFLPPPSPSMTREKSDQLSTRQSTLLRADQLTPRQSVLLNSARRQLEASLKGMTVSGTRPTGELEGTSLRTMSFAPPLPSPRRLNEDDGKDVALDLRGSRPRFQSIAHRVRAPEPPLLLHAAGERPSIATTVAAASQLSQLTMSFAARRTAVGGAVSSRAPPSPLMHLDAVSETDHESSNKAEASAEPQVGVSELAKKFIEKCGSLEKAFAYFDYNKNGKVTRSQWTTGLALLQVNCEATTGLSSNAVFKMLVVADSAQHAVGEVTHQAWKDFFSFAEGMDAGDALHNLRNIHLRDFQRLHHFRRRAKKGSSLAAAAVEPSEARDAADSDNSSGSSSKDENEGVPAGANRSRWTSFRRAVNAKKFSVLQRKEEDERLDILAEQAVLEDEIRELGITGVEALAFILTAKLGSLKKAFAYFDTARQGKMARIGWDMGLSLLKLDVERLCGATSTQFFAHMDGVDKNGVVTRKEFFQYFKEAATDELMDMARAVGAELADKVAAKKEKLRKQLQCAKAFGLKNLTKLLGVAPGAENKPSPAEDEGNPARQTPGATRQAGGQTYDVKKASKASSADAFEEKVYAILRTLQPDEWHDFGAGLTEDQEDIVQSAASNLNIWTHMVHEGDSRRILAMRMGDTAMGIRQDLEELADGERLVYPATLSLAHRTLVYALSAESGYSAHSVGDAESAHLEVFNMPDFEKELQHELNMIPEDVEHTLESTFNEAESQLAVCIAHELGLDSVNETVEEGSHQITVGNLQSLRSTVGDELATLLPGDARKYGSSDTEPLTPLRRKTIAQVAKEQSFHLEVEEDSEELTVTRLDALPEEEDEDAAVYQAEAFEAEGKEVDEEAETEEEASFGVSADVAVVKDEQNKDLLQATADVAVHEETGLRTPRKATKKGRQKEGKKAKERAPKSKKSANESDDEDRESSVDLEVEEMEEIEIEPEEYNEEASMISRLFEQYATGVQGGKRVFLRFPDLGRFIDDLKGTMPEKRRMFRRFTGKLESLYEDTLQLQHDMGLRVTSGLTRWWFQVFIQKAARALGVRMMSMLKALLD